MNKIFQSPELWLLAACLGHLLAISLFVILWRVTTRIDKDQPGSTPLSIEEEIDEIDIQRLTKLLEPSLGRFAGMVLSTHRREHQGIEGDYLEELAIECGLLETRVVTDYCGENCMCDPGFTCCFLTEKGRAAIAIATGLQ